MDGQKKYKLREKKKVKRKIYKVRFELAKKFKDKEKTCKFKPYHSPAELNPQSPAAEEKSENIFLESIKGLTPDDIQPNEAVKNRKKKQFDYVRYIMMTVCIGVFIYSGFGIVQKVVGYVVSDIENSKLRDMFYENVSETDIEFIKKPKKIIPMIDILSRQAQNSVQISAEVSEKTNIKIQNNKQVKLFKNMNPDMCFWIIVPDTGIDYPVVQSTDNDFYLTHDFNKKKDRAGAIFLDYTNDRDIEKNYNAVIYGHNMLDSTMFRDLCYFGDYKQKFMDGTIEIITSGATYIYQIFSAYVCQPQYDYRSNYFETGEDFVKYCTRLEKKSNFHRPDFTITEDDRIITLSTCTMAALLDLRFAVHGKLIEVITDPAAVEQE